MSAGKLMTLYSHIDYNTHAVCFKITVDTVIESTFNQCQIAHLTVNVLIPIFFNYNHWFLRAEPSFSYFCKVQMQF